MTNRFFFTKESLLITYVQLYISQMLYKISGNLHSAILDNLESTRLPRSPRQSILYSQQDFQSPAITSSKIKYSTARLPIPGNYSGSKNKFCPARSHNSRQLYVLAKKQTSLVRQDLTIPDNYCSFHNCGL